MKRVASLGVQRGIVGLMLAMPSCNGEPEPNSDATQSGSTTGAPDACMAGDDCPDAFCVAPWDAELGQRAPAECVAECITNDDLTRFCIDDASCCEGSRCNAGDGLCAAEAAESSSTDSTTTGASTSDGSTSFASSSTDATSTDATSTSSSG